MDDTLAFDPEAAAKAIADVYRQAVADDDGSDDDGDYNDYDEDGNYEDADEQFVDSDDSDTDEDMPSLEALDLQDCLDDQGQGIYVSFVFALGYVYQLVPTCCVCSFCNHYF